MLKWRSSYRDIGLRGLGIIVKWLYNCTTDLGPVVNLQFQRYFWLISVMTLEQNLEATISSEMPVNY